MKKPIVHIVLFSMLALILFACLPLSVTAQKSAATLNTWADNMVRSPEDPPYLSLHYRLRKLYFAVDPTPVHPVVFLGDSITYGGDWHDLFPQYPVENRGIGGDSTLGLLNRLDQIIALQPSQIFLMIGTNDLCYGRSIPKIIDNYRLILSRFQRELPSTKVYVQSVLPFNDTMFPARGLRNNNEIVKLNAELNKVAEQYRYPYLNLTNAFTGTDGRLPVEYTSDGLHLSKAGYLCWREQIKDLLIGSSQAASL